MNLNEFGKIVDAEWQNLKTKYPNVNIGEYIIMPNHFHGIIEMTERTITVGNIIGYFKYKTTKMINLPEKLWQRNYWEHIIRSETEYAKIAEYIRNNPVLWGRKCLGEILPVR
jgi:REP element-mobilizing transposase RayT